MRIRANVNHTTGITAHYIGSYHDAGKLHCDKVSGFDFVETVQEDGLFFVYRYDTQGRCVADTCHMSEAEAKRQAELEFAISESSWVAVN
jgi:hypothetical protein